MTTTTTTDQQQQQPTTTEVWGSFTILHGGMEVGIFFSDQVLKVEALGETKVSNEKRAPKGCLGDLLGMKSYPACPASHSLVFLGSTTYILINYHEPPSTWRIIPVDVSGEMAHGDHKSPKDGVVPIPPSKWPNWLLFGG